MIGDIIEIERAKRTAFEAIEETSLEACRDSGNAAALANDNDAPRSGFAMLMASVRDKLGQFKIRLD